MSKTTVYILLEHGGGRLDSWRPIAMSLDKSVLVKTAKRRSMFSDRNWDIKQRTFDSLKPDQIKYLV